MEYIYYCPSCGYFNVKDKSALDAHVCGRCNKRTYDTQMSKTEYDEKSLDEKNNFKEDVKNKMILVAYYNLDTNLVEDVLSVDGIENVSSNKASLGMKYLDFQKLSQDEKERMINDIKKRFYVHLDFLNKKVVYLSEIYEVDLNDLKFNDYIYLNYTLKQWDDLSSDKKTIYIASSSKYYHRAEQNIFRKSVDVIVTTGDLKQDYDVKGLVYYQINNRGLFSNQVINKKTEYRDIFDNLSKQGLISQKRIDFGSFYGNRDVGSNLFEDAFHIAVFEMKKKAAALDADAVIAMRQDIDIETEGQNNFYLQMYGTAVKIKK